MLFFQRTYRLIFKNSRHKRNQVFFKQQCCSLSTYTRISVLPKVANNESATVKGWVKSVRKLKDILFVDVSDGSCSRPLQVVIPKDSLKKPIAYGSSIVVSGHLKTNPNNLLELSATTVDIIGECSMEEFPFRPKKAYTNEYIREHLHLRFRTRGFASLIRVRNEAGKALSDFFSREGYIVIHAPVLTSNDCEGAGEVFSVIPDSESLLASMKSPNLKPNETFFGNNAYLTVSSQLHLEAAARGMGNVFSFGPTFRAENSKSRLHLSEFYMVEAETPFVSSIEDVTSVAEGLVKHMSEYILSNCSEDVHLCRKSLGEPGEQDILPFEKLVQSKFAVLSYEEASQILKKNSDKLKIPHIPKNTFTKEQELFLVKYNSYKPLFVVDWPSSLKPFYMKQNPNNPVNVDAFDLLCDNVGELCGGSLREDDYVKLEHSLSKANLTNKLKWYLDLRKYGNVTTGGFGMGYERFLQVLLSVSNIKDTIPFPRWPHNCKM